ncbi:MAG: AEC family transporter, partial [Muribaculaceae bacterium]|nr:AEC family transporter [Muribaculaceae bacterium]
MKLIVMPAESLIVGLLVHMDPVNLKMLVVACALPPAFSGIIIADEYNTYVATGTSSLTLSVILFVGFCPLWIWLTDLALANGFLM